MSWISVKDRLPEFGAVVRLHSFEKGVYEGDFYFDDNGSFCDKNSVKAEDWDGPPDHWIPVPELPDPPKKN